MAPRRNTPRLNAAQRAERRWGILPPPDTGLERLKAAQRADLAEADRWAGELRRGWFERKLHAWTRRFERLGKWAKAALTFGTALGALLGAGARVWQYIADRRIPPAELPAGDTPTITTDRVPEPKPPGR